MKIRIFWKSGELIATLRDTATSQKLLACLPCKSSCNTWGDEIYFSLPMESTLEEDAKQVVDPGTVCFWVEGNSIAIPFGPTPISKGDECRLAARVNLLGDCIGDPKILGTIKEGDIIQIEKT
ncbi:MAG: hypothetical protein HQL69_13150 [Magnetococcales bacterium]|nr:hypothetical protein [Magnetococcales bacterium]